MLWSIEIVSHPVVSDSAMPWTVAHQSPLSMEFSRQDYWSGLPCPTPWNLPDPGIEPRSPALRQILYHLSRQGSTNLVSKKINADFHLSDTAKYSTNNPQHRCLWHLPKLGNHTSRSVCINVYVFMHMCVCVKRWELGVQKHRRLRREDSVMDM